MTSRFEQFFPINRGSEAHGYTQGQLGLAL